jgi:hypothetical protein
MMIVDSNTWADFFNVVERPHVARLDKALVCESVQLIATVHDEVVMLVPDDTNSITRIGSIAQHEMEVAFHEIFPEAPTVKLVEPKVGRTWGDLQSLEGRQADGGAVTTSSQPKETR